MDQQTKDQGGDFGTAIKMLKAGLRVRRSGWNGKGMWLALWKPGTYTFPDPLFENSSPLREYAASNRSKSADVCGCIVMKTADGSLVFGWLASQTDMLSEDWESVLD